MIQSGDVHTQSTFCQEEVILLRKYRDRNGGCIAILFKSIGVGPDLPFLAFSGKTQGTPPKKQEFSVSSEPLKSLEKKGKTVEKTRNSLKGKKAGKSKKARKGRSGRGPFDSPDL